MAGENSLDRLNGRLFVFAMILNRHIDGGTEFQRVVLFIAELFEPEQWVFSL